MKLIINNSISQIVDMTREEFHKIREILSYKIPAKQAYFSGSNWNPIRYLIDKKGYFSNALIYKLPTSIKIEDQRTIPGPKKLFELRVSPTIPYVCQNSAVRAASLMRNYPVCVQMPTGSGKSLVIAMLINEVQQRTLVVVPTLEIKKQTIKFLKDVFGKDCVGDTKNFDTDIAVENVDALIGKYEHDYDCVIIDEAHHGAAATYRMLNATTWKSSYYRFSFTATPFRRNDHEQILLESVTGQLVYELPYKEAVMRKYVCPVEAYYIEVPKTTVKTVDNTWASVYSELVVNNEPRNTSIAYLLAKLVKQGKSVLCLVREIKHGNTIAELTGLPFANGQDGDSSDLIRHFNSKASGGLVATEGVCGEGVDTRPCEYVIIAGLGVSRGALMQKVGRSVRMYPGKESAKVIIVKDSSHKWTKKHFDEQCRILKQEYGVVPVKLDLIGSL